MLDAGDPAAALLDAAALMTVARRAGFRPEQGVAGRPRPPEDAAPELSPRAERALRQLGGAQLAPGFAAGDKELLADLLTAAGDAGYVASAPLLPDLLDAAVRTTALRPVVAAVLGVRGRWLAGHRADWQRVVDAAGPAATVPSADPEVWRTGSRGERHAYLAALRERDPERRPRAAGGRLGRDCPPTSAPPCSPSSPAACQPAMRSSSTPCLTTGRPASGRSRSACSRVCRAPGSGSGRPSGPRPCSGWSATGSARAWR